MKKCTICKIEKDEVNFNKNKTRKDGISNVCKICSREKSSTYYNSNLEKHREEVTKRNNVQRGLLKDFIKSTLITSKCKDCGNKDWRVLEFDHLPNFKKRNDISYMVKGGYSLESIKDEISKCEVVCRNCHCIRTIERSEKDYRKDSSVA